MFSLQGEPISTLSFERSICHEVCPGELQGGSPAFLMQKRETPGAVEGILQNA